MITEIDEDTLEDTIYWFSYEGGKRLGWSYHQPPATIPYIVERSTFKYEPSLFPKEMRHVFLDSQGKVLAEEVSYPPHVSGYFRVADLLGIRDTVKIDTLFCQPKPEMVNIGRDFEFLERYGW